jgi:hypothetical protein
MRFVRKLIDPIKLTEVPLVVLALMFKCDPRVETKEGREKRVGAICYRRSGGRRRNQASHLRKGNGHSCTIVKEDSIWKIHLVLQGIRYVDGKMDAITVPETSMPVTGSIRSTRVSGG